MKNSLGKAIAWIKNNSLNDECVVVSSVQYQPYPEVTGYLIPTLCHYKETSLAHNYARWLTKIQKEDGSFSAPRCKGSFAFDTGQALRGLVAVLPALPELEDNVRRACDWLIGHSSTEGRLPLPEELQQWSLHENRGMVPEAIHLYVLPAISQAGQLLGNKLYTDFVKRSLDFYLRNFSLSDFRHKNMLSHFYLYIQEALCELGAQETAQKGMKSLEPFQGKDGSVPAYSDSSWVCSPGQAQAALVWFLLGETTRAQNALLFLESKQNPSGGFWGSFGDNANYLPNHEPSWTIKFYLDAYAHSPQQPNSQKARASKQVKKPSTTALLQRCQLQISRLIQWGEASEAEVVKLKHDLALLQQKIPEIQSNDLWKLIIKFYNTCDQAGMMRNLRILFREYKKSTNKILNTLGSAKNPFGGHSK